MQYEKQAPSPPAFKPRVVIHGGAGNIVRSGYPVEKYQQYRRALLEIVSVPAYPSSLNCAANIGIL